MDHTCRVPLSNIVVNRLDSIHDAVQHAERLQRCVPNDPGHAASVAAHNRAEAEADAARVSTSEDRIRAWAISFVLAQGSIPGEDFALIYRAGKANRYVDSVFQAISDMAAAEAAMSEVHAEASAVLASMPRSLEWVTNPVYEVYRKIDGKFRDVRASRRSMLRCLELGQPYDRRWSDSLAQEILANIENYRFLLQQAQKDAAPSVSQLLEAEAELDLLNGRGPVAQAIRRALAPLEAAERRRWGGYSSNCEISDLDLSCIVRQVGCDRSHVVRIAQQEFGFQIW